MTAVEDYVVWNKLIHTEYTRVWDKAVRISAGLRAGQSGARISVGERVFLFSKQSNKDWDLFYLPFYRYRGSFPGLKWSGCEVNNSYVVQRMSGVYPLLPLYDFMSWTGTTLHFSRGNKWKRIRCDIEILCPSFRFVLWSNFVCPDSWFA